MKKWIIFLFILFLSARGNAGSDTAIILIDMQEEFIKNTDDFEFRNLIEKQKQLLELGIKNEVPLLVFEYNNGGETLGELQSYINKFRQYAYVTKYNDGGFHYSPLNRIDPASLLRSWGVSKLIITGVNGPYCVLKTSQGGLNNSFHVYTSGDLVADLSLGRKDFYDCSWWPVEESEFYGFNTLSELIGHLDF